jgi:hypothetical protein
VQACLSSNLEATNAFPAFVVLLRQRARVTDGLRRVLKPRQVMDPYVQRMTEAYHHDA